MSEQEMKKILQELDHMPMPNKETVMAACEEAFEAKHIQKTERNGFKPIFVKQKAMRIAALAACVCLLITGVFGGLHLFGGENPSAITEQGTPNLPLDQYPPDEVDYANMSMVEYMELFPDFLSYRYMPWEEGYAFAHLEILEVKGGYNTGDGNYNSHVVKCRVVSDAWNALEEGSELNLVVDEWRFFETVSSVLLRFPLRGTFVCTSKDGDSVRGMLFEQSLKWLGCFPLEDGKVNLEIMEKYLKENNLKLNYDGNSLISNDPDYVYCTFDDVASIVADEMNVETALENLRNVYEKYQTGEYNNYLRVYTLSKMTYGEYVRFLNQESTVEDFEKHGTFLKLAYLNYPKKESRDVVLSDGTVYPILTVMKLPESEWERLMTEVAEFEKACTDENGVLDAEACIQKIKDREGFYNVMSVLTGYDLR